MFENNNIFNNYYGDNNIFNNYYEDNIDLNELKKHFSKNDLEKIKKEACKKSIKEYLKLDDNDFNYFLKQNKIEQLLINKRKYLID